jgi:hypothetical protein
MRLATALAVVLVLLACPATTPAAETNGSQRFELDYDARWGPFSVLTLRTSARIEPEAGNYRSEILLFTRGVVSWVYPWRARSETLGTIVDDTLHPRRHRSVGSYRGSDDVVEIDYRDDGTVETFSDPPLDGDELVGDDLRRSTLDALTATLIAVRAPALGERCAGILPVFDGRRRYDLFLHDLGEVELEPSGSRMYEGPARHCRAIVRVLGGAWRDDMPYGERLASIDYWVARVDEDLPAVPVEMALEGKSGTLQVYLTGAR